MNIELIPTKKNPDIRQVRLFLPFESRTIGKLQGETFSCKRTDKHIFNKTNSLGLNYQLLKNERLHFKWIVIDLVDSVSKKLIRKLVTSRNYFLQFGQYFEFRQKHFEGQIFLRLDDFGIEKARMFEDSLKNNLFSEVIQ